MYGLLGGRYVATKRVLMNESRLDGELARGRWRWRRGVGLVLAALVVWAVLGFVRAPAVARDYYLSRQGTARVTQIGETVFPAIPPFWGVSIQGTVTEASGVAYTSAMLLWVEPVTGWVLSMGAG
jgi:hypothetical protein